MQETQAAFTLKFTVYESFLWGKLVSISEVTQARMSNSKSKDVRSAIKYYIKL